MIILVYRVFIFRLTWCLGCKLFTVELTQELYRQLGGVGSLTTQRRLERGTKVAGRGKEDKEENSTGEGKG